MGVIIRQSLKNSAVNYFSILVGAICSLFIYPLDWFLYGNIQFVISSAILLSAVLSLGSYTLVNKYYPYFKNFKIEGFLTLVIIIGIASCCLSTVLLYLLGFFIQSIREYIDLDLDRINELLYIIYPIGILLVFRAIFRAYSFSNKRIVVPDLITILSQKIFVAFLILFSYWGFFNEKISYHALLMYFIAILIVLIIYVKRISPFKWSLKFLGVIKRSKYTEMLQFMSYGGLNHIASILSFKIDLIMIGLVLDPIYVGYYSFFLFAAVVIDIPKNALTNIAGPMVSDFFEKNQFDRIKEIYLKVSNNLLILGIGLLSIVLLNLDLLLPLLKDGEELVKLKYIFLLIALSKIIELLSGLSLWIIWYSKYYRFNLFNTILTAGLNIILNYYFIYEYGLIGIAISTLLTFSVYNIVKVAYVYTKFKIHPFNKKMNIPIFILICVVIIEYLLEEQDGWFLTIIVRSSIFVVMYLLTIYFGKCSMDINKRIDIQIEKLKKVLK